MGCVAFSRTSTGRWAAVAILVLAGPALAMAQPTPYLPPAGPAVATISPSTFAPAVPPVIEVPSCPQPTCAYRPLVTVTAMPPTYEVGRGILGQPKLYVPRQPVRNFVRWLTP